MYFKATLARLNTYLNRVSVVETVITVEARSCWFAYCVYYSAGQVLPYKVKRLN